MSQEPEPKGGVASSPEAMRKVLADVACESWRFSGVLERLLRELSPDSLRRYEGRVRFFQKKLLESLEAAGMRIKTHEGEPYDTGMAATALNRDEFGPDDLLQVDQMVEPIVMGPDGLIRIGTMTLRKQEKT